MSTNPNNAVGTNGAYGGRTSVKASNDILSALSGRGVLSGWSVRPDNGMTLSVGGVASTRDVAIGEDNNGNRTTINNISEVPISVDIPAAPASNSRIDSLVVYVDNPPQGTANAVDNPGACGLIVVSSDIAGTPTPPSDTAIRAAITADGASGSTAFFCILADVRVAAGTTNITANMITMKEKTSAGVAEVDTENIVDGAITNPKLATGAVKSQNIDFTTLGYQELRANKATAFVGSAYTKLIYDNVLSQQGTGLFNYDTTTGVITATKACKIDLSASIYPASAYPACLISVYKGDTPSTNNLLARAGKAAGDYNGLHLSVSVRLNAGDQLCLDYYCNAAVNANQLGSMLFVGAEQRG